MDGLWKVVVITIILAIIAGAVVLILNPSHPTPVVITPGTEKTKNRIGIFGAVQTPGFYEYEGYIRIEDAVNLAGGMSEEADIVNGNLSKWVEDGETIIIPTLGEIQPTLTVPPSNEEKIDLNHATAEELMKLPGIGEKRAADIIRMREQKGSFNSIEELLEINGISEKLLNSIYDQLILTE